MNLNVGNVTAPVAFRGKGEKTPRPNPYQPEDLDKAVDRAQRALSNYNAFPGTIYSLEDAQGAAQVILLHNLTQKVAEIMKK